MVRVLAWAAAAATAAGCSYARGVGEPSQLAPGRPEYVPGLAEGYWIWQERGSWHLRTSAEAARRFHGAVEPVGGKLSEVRAVGAAPPRVGSRGQRVEFDYAGSGAEQGLDWHNSSGCTRFELFIDGDPTPLRVFLGGTGESPMQVPFAVCR